MLYGHETKRVIGYGYIDQLKDLAPYLFLSIISAIPAMILSFSNLHDIVIILCGGCSSIAIYILLLYLRKDPIFVQYFWDNPKIASIRAKLHL